MLSAALYARVRLHTLLHTRPPVQRAPGIPCALFLREVRKLLSNFGRLAPRDRGVIFGWQPRHCKLLNRNNSQQRAAASEWRLHMRSSLDVHDRPAKRAPMSKHAHTVKTRVAAISIFASAGMAAAKFIVGILIGSLALVSEALHSSVDVVATIITWMVVRVSDLPADEEHQYGHGKFESVSALGVIAILYVLAGGILVG